ncbi:hypothetical protein CR105_15940 [Massilia eurypsychrophila]|jgi:hypothetical protein|uniref:Uncharacterized protein n=1 Tax=Massilia eurypsychrophila TaxID=1485217 RepID=A0A2G8TDQ6_9BURK|nr:hypothetical protein [Massilia eurypsychrophila]PIL44186.1 hypothetical protein CR105_15940 [Massilia eurypsychrophila]
MQTDKTRDPGLTAPLSALRDGMASLNTPRGVHKELMAAFASHHRKRRWYQTLSPAQWGVAGSLGGIAAVLLVTMLALQAPMPATGDATASIGRDNGAAFIALDSFERIEQDPAPRMVEATVPRTALASLGVPVSPENAGDLVHAEMLVGHDGHPLALRLAVQ